MSLPLKVVGFGFENHGAWRIALVHFTNVLGENLGTVRLYVAGFSAPFLFCRAFFFAVLLAVLLLAFLIAILLLAIRIAALIVALVAVFAAVLVALIVALIVALAPVLLLLIVALIVALILLGNLPDALGKLDGNDELDALLGNIVQNTEELKALRGSEAAETAAASADAPTAE